MNNRDYRELQLSSTQLILIFLALIAVGVVIFLLGISVGKKQAQVSAQTQPPVEQVIAQKPSTTPSRPSTTESGSEETPSKKQETAPPPAEEEKPEPEPEKKAPTKTEEKPATTSSSGEVKNMYYIQVGAYSRKEGAMSLAEDFKGQGYPTIILDPFPTDRRAIFRVRVGGYETREEAETIKAELLKLTGKKESDFFIRFVK